MSLTLSKSLGKAASGRLHAAHSLKATKIYTAVCEFHLSPPPPVRPEYLTGVKFRTIKKKKKLGAPWLQDYMRNSMIYLIRDIMNLKSASKLHDGAKRGK